MATNEVDPAGNTPDKETVTTTKNVSAVKDSAGQVDIRQLLEAGAHFGHKTSRWHPGMRHYIHSKRNGTHIIDLTKTVDCLETALKFIEDTAADGKQILFVATKRQAQPIIKKLAEDLGMPYVVERWLGGMLTNHNTIGGRIKHLKDLEEKMASGALAAKYSKLEVQRFQEEIDEMNHIYGGIKNLAARPGAVFVVDITHDVNVIREARKLKVPIVALADSNADPRLATYPIPANDDAIKTIQLIADYVRKAVESGQARREKKQLAADKDEK
jgi:small subunit ribosomal protein S2